MSLPLTPPLSAFLFLLSFLQKLPPHRSLPLTLTDLTRPSNMTHPLVKVHQECSSKHVIIKNPFSFPKLEGKDAAPGLTERDCASASCTVVIASRSISLLPPSTGVTGVLILIVGLLLDSWFTPIPPWIRRCCCGPKDYSLLPLSAVHPWTDETSQRAVIHWRRVALLLSCLSHNFKAS